MADQEQEPIGTTEEEIEVSCEERVGSDSAELVCETQDKPLQKTEKKRAVSQKRTKKKRKSKIRFMDKAKLTGIGLVVGLIIGVIGAVFVQNYNPPDEEQYMDPTIVFERIQAENELVCASQVYSITDKFSNVNRLFDMIEIPITHNSFWYRYVGIIKVGVSLAQADFSCSGNTITVELMHPRIISNEQDMDRSRVLEENNNLLNPIHVQDIDNFQKWCKEQSEAYVAEGGIMEEARQNAEQNLRDMFNAALGDTYTVEFHWKEADGR